MFAEPAVRARGLTLRAARADDAPFLRALFETARADAAFLSAWPEDVRRTFLDQQFEFQRIHYARVHPNAEHWVVECDSTPIGRLILVRAPQAWCVVDIALLPVWRGQGIGTLLLQNVKAAAARAIAPRLCLSVDMRNPARRLYQRLGFAAEQEDDGAINVEMAWRPPTVS